MPVVKSTLHLPESCAIVGCNGAIGSAVGARLKGLGVSVHGFDIAGSGSPLLSSYTQLSQGPADEQVAAFTSGLDAVNPASLVIASGVYPARPLKTETGASLLDVLTINAVVPALLVRAFLEGADGDDATVVVTSSLAALRARVGTAAYSASKAALERLLESLALEYRHTRVRINTVQPGYVSTRSTMNPIPAPYDAKMKAADASSDPDDLVDSYLWLLSSESRQLHGDVVPIDRGMRLGSASETAWLN